MFIYSITVANKKYYGLDTGDVNQHNRWKEHQRAVAQNYPDTKLYSTMREHGIKNCVYEIVEDGFTSISDLAAAEIRYISEGDTYRNGLNGSPGGDGLGHHNLVDLSDEEYNAIRKALSESLSEYNRKIKWANLSDSERKKLTSHLHTEEVYQKRSKTLKETYKNRPDLREERRKIRSKWIKDNPDKAKEIQQKASLAGAAKLSKKVHVEFEDGTIREFSSKREYTRQYGHNIQLTLEKTKQNKKHNGRRAWET